MSISSLLTTEAPLSPTVPPVVPSSSSRHSNIQLTASSSRPQRRKSSMDIPAPNMALSLSNKKRKREGDDMEVFKYIFMSFRANIKSRVSANGKFPKIKFKSSAMDSMVEGITDESDGLDDAEFLAEHEKYLENCAKHRFEILKGEADRQNVC